MIVRVNGKDRDAPAALTVRELLQWLEVKEEITAVAVNEEVVRKGQWDTTRIQEGDRVEIVRIVAGG